MDQASDVFKLNEDHELLAALKMAGLDGQKEKVDELSVKFEEHSEQLQEASWVDQRFPTCWVYNSGVRLCELEPEEECSEHADRIRYVLKNNKKTEQS